MGDLNDRCVKWEDKHPNSELGLKLVKLFCEHNLCQLVKTPTRGANLLDLFVTNSANSVLTCDVLRNFDLSLDHLPIISVLNFNSLKSSSSLRTIKLYSEENLQNLNRALSSIPWHNLLALADDIDHMVDIFYHLLNDEVNLHIPTRVSKINSKDKPGMTSHIRRLFNRARYLNRIAKRTGDISDINEHKKARKLAKTTWRRAKNVYYDKLLSENTNTNDEYQSVNVKHFWRVLKKNTNSERITTRVPDLKSNNTVIVDAVDKANMLNNYFTKPINESVKEIIPSSFMNPILIDGQGYIAACSEDVNVDVAAVIQQINLLDTSKANGPDDISNRLLLACGSSLAISLEIIFTKSLSTGVFPKLWKTANVVPIYKNKGEKCDPSSYRPISLLSTISKIFEKLIYNYLYNFLTSNNLLYKLNSGFKKGDGTVNQLLHVTHQIYKNFDEGLKSVMVFLDFRSAFDSVWHSGLLLKIKSIGIGGTLFNWFESYLSNRTQRVVLDGASSDTKVIQCGVPQGSVLGPLLFLIYVNDLCDDLSSTGYLFADDATLFNSFKAGGEVEISNTLNKDLNTIYEWTKKWKLQINAMKTSYVVFNTKNKIIDLKLSINNNLLTPVDEHKH